LRYIFESIDTHGTGMIDAAELRAYLQTNKLHMSDDDQAKLIKELDYSGNGQINWNEFVSATIDTEKLLTT